MRSSDTTVGQLRKLSSHRGVKQGLTDQLELSPPIASWCSSPVVPTIKPGDAPRYSRFGCAVLRRVTRPNSIPNSSIHSRSYCTSPTQFAELSIYIRDRGLMVQSGFINYPGRIWATKRSEKSEDTAQEKSISRKTACLWIRSAYGLTRSRSRRG